MGKTIKRMPCGGALLVSAAFILSILLGSTLASRRAEAQQSFNLYVQPVFLYQFYNVQDCGGCNDVPSPWYPEPSGVTEAWNYAQSVVNGTHDGSTYTAYGLNVPSGTIYIDGYPTWYDFSVQSCQSGNCNDLPNTGYLQGGNACPANWSEGDFNYTGSTQLDLCFLAIYNILPCPTCLGDPIYPATGQNFEPETDYKGPTGLDFTRTYRSNNGSFTSVTTQLFVNNSGPAAQQGERCYPAFWTYSSTTGSYCFPFESAYPDTGSAPQYQLLTAEGRTLLFTGPNNAIAQNADINDRLTQIAVNGATEWQVHRADDSIEIYDVGGSLIQKTLRGGQVFTYTYSTASTPGSIAPQPGLMLTQSDAFGHTLSWQYNSLSQLSQMKDPAGNIYQYYYDAHGNLTSVLYPDGTDKTYWYNESANTGGANLPNALTGVTDESGARYSTFQYSNPYSQPLAVNTQQAGGVNSYAFSYNGSAYFTGATVTAATVIDPLGTSRTYNYSFNSNLTYNVETSDTQPAASGSGTATQSKTYDANGNVTSVTDYNGNVTEYTLYDMTRNLEESRTEAYGTPQARTITTKWDPVWRQPDLITEPNRTTAFTYDSLGNVHIKTITDLTVTPNVTRTWTYTYDSYGRIQTVLGPRSNGYIDKTSYTYYTCTTGTQCGEVETITNNAGHTTTFNSYNAHGQPLTITDPNGVVTTLMYDTRQRLTSRKVATDLTQYSYWPTGFLKQITLPDLSTISFKYDPAHRLTDITDGLGNNTHYTLDNMGNRTGENTYDPTGALHRLHTRMIDALNNLHEDINSAGTAAVTTTYGYDNNGNQTSVAAPLGRNTANQYDALNRLSQITDPMSGVTKLGYDGNDNLASVMDPKGLTTTYGHNGFDDLAKIVSPDTGTTSFTYDSGGNPKTATDARGVVTNYSFDNGNRLVQLIYGDQTISYSYDAGTYGKDRLSGASDANHSMSWTYDALGHVNGKSQIVSNITRSVGYGYTNGDMVSLVTPSGQTIVYGYTNHQITSITVNSTTLLNTVTYDPFGPVTGWTWGNGQAVTRTYDEDGNPKQIVTAGVTNAYTVDYASRITGISDGGLASNSWTFGYDLLDRSSTASSSAKSRGYQYDANSNRITTTGTTPSTETVSPTSNQLNSTSGSLVRTYAYDAAGNTKSYTGTSFTFNDRGRMSSAVVNGAETDYIYNALGQLIQKSGNGGTTILAYDEAGHLLGEYTSAGALIQETIWMGDTPVATLRPSGSTIAIYYVHADHLNTPRKVTRPSDNGLMWRYDPDTFSSSTSTPNQNPSGLGNFVYNLRFPGQYYLSESGLFYNVARTFDPQVGRYLESDSTGLLGGINTYSYAADNPVNNADPTGLSPTSIILQLYYRNKPKGSSCPDDDEKSRCQQVKNEAIEQCSDATLPTFDHSAVSFHRCVSRIMEARGCGGPGGTPTPQSSPVLPPMPPPRTPGGSQSTSAATALFLALLGVFGGALAAP